MSNDFYNGYMTGYLAKIASDPVKSTKKQYFAGGEGGIVDRKAGKRMQENIRQQVKASTGPEALSTIIPGMSVFPTSTKVQYGAHPAVAMLRKRIAQRKQRKEHQKRHRDSIIKSQETTAENY